MARTGPSSRYRANETRQISIGAAAYRVVDQTICQRLLESLVFHFRGYVQLLAIRGQAISASGFPAWALCHNGQLAILPLRRSCSLALAFRYRVFFGGRIARGILREDAAGFSRDLYVRAGLLDSQCLEFIHHAAALRAALAIPTTLSSAAALARVTARRLHLLAHVVALIFVQLPVTSQLRLTSGSLLQGSER